MGQESNMSILATAIMISLSLHIVTIWVLLRALRDQWAISTQNEKIREWMECAHCERRDIVASIGSLGRVASIASTASIESSILSKEAREKADSAKRQSSALFDEYREICKSGVIVKVLDREIR